ncbi:hypothetical protein L3Q82_023734 [Scortum barcoo]|uniref:Uncharacterized protein n=1 Tax=Scortum barcoo TaxID=214431 RepID=A0ACB8WUV2_9TELE|nr:hypothetical protein L3Q82_023734 [Scortum barcoo]
MLHLLFISPGLDHTSDFDFDFTTFHWRQQRSSTSVYTGTEDHLDFLEEKGFKDHLEYLDQLECVDEVAILGEFTE